MAHLQIRVTRAGARAGLVRKIGPPRLRSNKKLLDVFPNYFLLLDENAEMNTKN